MFRTINYSIIYEFNNIRDIHNEIPDLNRNVVYRLTNDKIKYPKKYDKYIIKVKIKFMIISANN